jgi:Protein of unknown function (DUF2997)
MRSSLLKRKAMAEYQKIEYHIGPNGVVSETVLNGRGGVCLLATDSLEKALGEIESRELLPEHEADGDTMLVIEQFQTLQVQE